MVAEELVTGWLHPCKNTKDLLIDGLRVANHFMDQASQERERGKKHGCGVIPEHGIMHRPSLRLHPVLSTQIVDDTAHHDGHFTIPVNVRSRLGL